MQYDNLDSWQGSRQGSQKTRSKTHSKTHWHVKNKAGVIVMKCPNCGTQIKDDANFCLNCGTVLGDQFAAVPPPAYAPVPPPTGIPTMIQPMSSVETAVEPPPAAHYQQPPYLEYNLDQPMSLGSYIISILVLLIPFLNIIMVLIWSFGRSVNHNKKNLARAFLVFMVITFVLSIFFSKDVVNYVAHVLFQLP
jgi:hypothetical protein